MCLQFDFDLWKYLILQLIISNTHNYIKDGELSALRSGLPNKQLLFHGSRASNFVGLLSRGVLMPKLVVQMGGKRRDAGLLGVYFTSSYYYFFWKILCTVGILIWKPGIRLDTKIAKIDTQKRNEGLHHFPVGQFDNIAQLLGFCIKIWPLSLNFSSFDAMSFFSWNPQCNFFSD